MNPFQFSKIYTRIKQLVKFHFEKLEAIQVQQGRLHQSLNQGRFAEFERNIQLAEFSVFSQWGDDGIIDFLTSYLDFEHKTFLEFGVENFREANTRFLLINKNWSGLVADGSRKNIEHLKADSIYWKYDLKAVYSFITKENINQLIEENGFSHKIGLLHIDIDGNDYHIWEAIHCIHPTLVIMEYNSVFGPSNPWTIPYDPAFSRSEKHYSHLYCGASLKSLEGLAKQKGYSLIGTNSAGNNAYFVRNENRKGLKALSAEEAFTLSKFAESRDKHGNLNFVRGSDRLSLLKGMTVLNTESGSLEII